EMLGDPAVLLLVDPPEGHGVGNAVEAEVIRGLHLRADRAGRVEEGLVVLEEVEFPLHPVELECVVGGGPEGSDGGISRLDLGQVMKAVERPDRGVVQIGEGASDLATDLLRVARLDAEAVQDAVFAAEGAGEPEDGVNSAVEDAWEGG